MSSALESDFNMADVLPSATNLDYLHAPLDFENGFGFSPATSPARDSHKQDFGGYFTNAMNDSMSFFDQNEGELFNNNSSSSNNNTNYSQTTPLQSFAYPPGFSTVNAKVTHGQVTPPSDNSPVTPKREVDNEPTPVSLDEPATVPRTNRKKRARQQSQTSQTSTQSAPKRQRTSGARKGSADSAVDGDVKDEKRSKFLERNRVAASKCRMKKKEWTANLEQKARDLQQNKTQLSILVNSLRDEVLYLKGEVLKHDTCNCTALRKYMSQSVSQISGEPLPLPPPSGKLSLSAGPSPASDLDLDGMSFAGSPQLAATADSPSAKSDSPA